METIRRLARRGEIPSFKVGRGWRFDEDALQRWAETHHLRARVPHVLAIDDEENITTLVRRRLLPEGYRISTFNEGFAALEFFRHDPPDVVLLDLKMPGMDGPAILKEIREIDEDVPVVIITGYPDGDLMMEAMRYSPLMVLPKPFDLNKLVKAVALAVGGSRPKSLMKEALFEAKMGVAPGTA